MLFPPLYHFHTLSQQSNQALILTLFEHIIFALAVTHEDSFTASKYCEATIVITYFNNFCFCFCFRWLKQQKFIYLFHNSVFESLRSGCQQGQVQVKTLFVACRYLPSLCGLTVAFPQCAHGEKEISCSLLIRQPILSYREPIIKTSFYLNYLQSHWELKLQHINFRGIHFSPQQFRCSIFPPIFVSVLSRYN